MPKEKKYYTVWRGVKPGVYNTWTEAKRQIDGYSGASYKSYKTRNEAEQAFKHPKLAQDVIKKNKKKIFYVVWQGFEPGIYTDWSTAQKQIAGFKKPKFKAFGSKQMAEEALENGPEKYAGRSFKKTKDMSPEDIKKFGYPNELSFCVDAACNDKGDMEYRGVFTVSGDEVFRIGPYKNGSNNVGEFLAIVHALAWLKKERSDLMIYSDSKYAMRWVENKRANTKATSTEILNLVRRAEIWLRENEYPNKIVKWQTKFWGEIPADFGRK